MDEMFVGLGIAFVLVLGSCVGCKVGENINEVDSRQKMIELNLAHYNQKTGKFVQDSISCKNDSCVIIRKNGE